MDLKGISSISAQTSTSSGTKLNEFKRSVIRLGANPDQQRNKTERFRKKCHPSPRELRSAAEQNLITSKEVTCETDRITITGACETDRTRIAKASEIDHTTIEKLIVRQSRTDAKPIAPKSRTHANPIAHRSRTHAQAITPRSRMHVKPIARESRVHAKPIAARSRTHVKAVARRSRTHAKPIAPRSGAHAKVIAPTISHACKTDRSTIVLMKPHSQMHARDNRKGTRDRSHHDHARMRNQSRNDRKCMRNRSHHDREDMQKRLHHDRKCMRNQWHHVTLRVAPEFIECTSRLYVGLKSLLDSTTVRFDCTCDCTLRFIKRRVWVHFSSESILRLPRRCV